MPHKFALDLSKFKMKSTDGKSSTLEHRDGHVVTIAHAPLSLKLRKQIDQMAEKMPKTKMANGGNVADKPDPSLLDKIGKPFGDVKQDPTPTPPPQQYADGTPDGPVQVLKDYKASEDAKQAPSSQDAQSEAPMVSDNMHPDSSQLAQDLQSIRPAEQSPQMVSAPPGPPSIAPPAATSSLGNGSDLTPPSPLNSEAGMPNAMEGYQKQQEGIQKTGEAEAAGARAQAATAQKAAQDFHDDLTAYQGEFQNLTKERNMVLSEFQKQQINPEHYWDNHSKLKSVIGLILGGFNPSSRPNAALELLNQQRDMDIKAQMANMDKSRSLLSANTAQFGNIKQGIEMTRIMQNDAMAAQLKADAMKQADPAARARAMQLAGQLEQESAMKFLPFVAQRALEKRYQQQDMQNRQQQQMVSSPGRGGTEGTIKKLLPEDPSIHVKMTPNASEGQKDAMYKEIAARQEVKHNAPNIMNLFDQAVKDQTKINTLGGIRDTGAATALKQAILPLFGPIDSTVRQAALDETLHNLIPSGYDTDEKAAYKRRAVINWLTSRAAAPVSKGHGVDLDRFESTAFDPKTFYTPKENAKISIFMHKNPQIRSVDEAVNILDKSGKI